MNSDQPESHIHQDANQKTIAAIHGLRNQYISIRDHRAVLEELQFRLDFALNDSSTNYVKTLASARLSTVTAASGAGKSTLIQNFLKLAEEAGHRHRALPVSLPAPCTIKTMTVAFLEALGDPMAHKVSATAASNTMRIIKLLKAKTIRMIIIDEFQHLLDLDRNGVRQETTDWLKSMLDQSGAEIVCVGLPNTTQVVQSNPQLERRTSGNLELKAISWDEGEGTIEFRVVLQELEKAMGFAEPFVLSTPETAYAIHQVTNGLIGRVVNLLERAVREAMKRTNGEGRISWEDLGRASMVLNIGMNNPFMAKNLARPANSNAVISHRAGPRPKSA
jgi:hypothetical protein